MGVKIILTNGNEHIIPDVADVTNKVVAELAKQNIETMVAESLVDNSSVISSIVIGSSNTFEDAVINTVNDQVLDSSNTSLQEAVRLIANAQVVDSSNTAFQNAVRLIVNEFCFSTADGKSSFAPALISVLSDPNNPVLDSSNTKLQTAIKDYLKYEAQIDSSTTKLIAINPSSGKFEGYNIPNIIVLTDEPLPATGITGDYCIVKDTEANTQTAYIYTEDRWEALNGNYDATNTYFKDNFKITKTFGKFEPDVDDGYVELPAAGKSIEALLKEAFATAPLPSVTWPSISLTATGNKTAEVGETIDLTALTVTPTASFGSYQYDDATGVKFIVPAKNNSAEKIDEISIDKPGFILEGKIIAHPASYKKYTSAEAKLFIDAEENVLLADTTAMNNTLTGLSKQALTIISGTNFLSGIKYEDDEYKIDWNFKVVHTDGNIPQDCLGNPAADAKITSKVISADKKTTKFTGYRKCFWTGISKDNAIANIKDKTFTSDEVRTFVKNGTAFTNTFTVAEGTKQVIFAAPDTKYVKGITLTNITNPSSPVPLGVSYTKQCEVEGANGYTAKNYNLWIVDLGNPFTVDTIIKVEEKK